MVVVASMFVAVLVVVVIFFAELIAMHVCTKIKSGINIAIAKQFPVRCVDCLVNGKQISSSSLRGWCLCI